MSNTAVVVFTIFPFPLYFGSIRPLNFWLDIYHEIVLLTQCSIYLIKHDLYYELRYVSVINSDFLWEKVTVWVSHFITQCPIKSGTFAVGIFGNDLMRLYKASLVDRSNRINPAITRWRLWTCVIRDERFAHLMLSENGLLHSAKPFHWNS